jgi:hypothetical protein
MSNLKAVQQGIPYGVYIWRIDGKAVVNEDLEYLQIASRRGDQSKIAALKKFVNDVLDIHEGEAFFEEGSRPISHEEWEDQMARQRNGEVPDPYDLGNLIEEYNYERGIDTK